jgi:hypothetical protein
MVAVTHALLPARVAMVETTHDLPAARADTEVQVVREVQVARAMGATTHVRLAALVVAREALATAAMIPDLRLLDLDREAATVEEAMVARTEAMETREATLATMAVRMVVKMEATARTATGATTATRAVTKAARMGTGATTARAATTTKDPAQPAAASPTTSLVAPRPPLRQRPSA